MEFTLAFMMMIFVFLILAAALGGFFISPEKRDRQQIEHMLDEIEAKVEFAVLAKTNVNLSLSLPPYINQEYYALRVVPDPAYNKSYVSIDMEYGTVRSARYMPLVYNVSDVAGKQNITIWKNKSGVYIG